MVTGSVAIIHRVRVVNLGNLMAKARAECSCGWTGKTVRYWSTAGKHAERHKAAVGGGQAGGDPS